MKLSKSPSLSVPNSVRAAVFALVASTTAACNNSNNSCEHPDVNDFAQIERCYNEELRRGTERFDSLIQARETRITSLRTEISARQAEMDRLIADQTRARTIRLETTCRIAPSSPGCPPATR